MAKSTGFHIAQDGRLYGTSMLVGVHARLCDTDSGLAVVMDITIPDSPSSLINWGKSLAQLQERVLRSHYLAECGTPVSVSGSPQ
jgi:hypothetical protein